jgi:hypothetical protein
LFRLPSFAFACLPFLCGLRIVGVLNLTRTSQ